MMPLGAARPTPGQALVAELRKTPDAGLTAAFSVLRQSRRATGLKGLGETPPKPERMDFGEEAFARLNRVIEAFLGAVVGILCTIGAEALTAAIIVAAPALAPAAGVIQAALGGLCIGFGGGLIADLLREFFTRLFPDSKVKELIKAIWESAYQTEMPADLLDRVFDRIDREDIVSVAGIYLVTINPDYDLGYQQRLREWQNQIQDESARRIATTIGFYSTSVSSILPLMRLEKDIAALPAEEIRASDREALRQRVRDKIVECIIDRDAHEAARKAGELAVRRSIIAASRPPAPPSAASASPGKTIVITGLIVGGLLLLFRRRGRA